MTDPIVLVTLSAATLAGLAMLVLAGLKGWTGWLELERLRLAGAAPPEAPAGARIELADLRERVRKLEAIAAGIDL